MGEPRLADRPGRAPYPRGSTPRGGCAARSWEARPGLASTDGSVGRMGTPRRIVVRRSVAAAVLVALLAAGCHSGDDPATPSTAPGPYTRVDVDAIVLGPDDAPDGIAYVDGVSGFQDLQAFARDATERAHLVEDGFQVGHLALFFPAGHANGGTPEPLTNRSTIVQGITGLVPRPGRRRAVTRAVRAGPALPPAPRRPRIPADGLGETSFGLRGKTSDGARVQIYVWRIGNLDPRRERERSAGAGRSPGPRRRRGWADLAGGIRLLGSSRVRSAIHVRRLRYRR